MIPESTIWNYVIQLTGALRVIHSAGLAFRTLDATKVILNGRSRIRLSFCAITDVLSFDPNASNPLALIPHLQVSIQQIFSHILSRDFKFYEIS